MEEVDSHNGCDYAPINDTPPPPPPPPPHLGRGGALVGIWLNLSKLPHGWGTSRVNFPHVPPTPHHGDGELPPCSPHPPPWGWLFTLYFFVYRGEVAIGELLNWFASLLLLVPYYSGHLHDLFSCSKVELWPPGPWMAMPHNAPPMGSNGLSTPHLFPHMVPRY